MRLIFIADRPRRPEAGATMLEFALVSITFVATIFALIDFSMVLYMRSSAAAAGQRALSWLSVQPALGNASAHPVLLAEADRRVKEYMASTTFIRDGTDGSTDRGAAYYLDSVQMIVPSTPSLAEGLKHDPLKIRVSFAYNPVSPIFLPSKMYFEAIATGFAERQPEEIEPMLIDCNGSRITSTVPPKKVFDPTAKRCVCRSVYQEQGNDCVCPLCPPGFVADDETCECGCPRGKEPFQGTCVDTCGKNFSRDEVTHACRCNLSSETCAPPQVFDAASCTCSGQSCPPNMILQDTTCVCDPNGAMTAATCHAAGKLWDPLACECGKQCGLYEEIKNNACAACPATYIGVGGKCVCPAGTDRYVQKGCSCKYELRDACNKLNQPINFSTCTCGETCPVGKIARDDVCHCPYRTRDQCELQDRILNDDCTCGAKCAGTRKAIYGHCFCNNDDRLFCESQGKILDPKTCGCVDCPPPKILKASKCVCPPGDLETCNSKGQLYDNSRCVCSGSCPAGKQPFGTTCLTCPSSAKIVGGVCVCPGGQILRNGQCRCPERIVQVCAEAGNPLDPLTCRCGCSDGSCCQLKPEDCALEAKRLDPDRCNCVGCPAGKVFYNGKCSKPE